MDLQRIFKKRPTYNIPDRPGYYSEYSAKRRGVSLYALDVDDCLTYGIIHQEH
jgi:hypothetical protein